MLMIDMLQEVWPHTGSCAPTHVRREAIPISGAIRSTWSSWSDNNDDNDYDQYGGYDYDDDDDVDEAGE